MNYKQIFKLINDWDNFVNSISILSKKEKGDAFEFLTKCLFEIKPQYTKLYDNVWLLSEVPQKELVNFLIIKYLKDKLLSFY